MPWAAACRLLLRLLPCLQLYLPQLLGLQPPASQLLVCLPVQLKTPPLLLMALPRLLLLTRLRPCLLLLLLLAPLLLRSVPAAA